MALDLEKGSVQYATCATAHASLSGATLCAWVRPETVTGANFNILFISTSGATSTVRLSLRIDSAASKYVGSARRVNADAGDNVTSTTTAVVGTTVHVCIVADYVNGTFKIFINGVLEATANPANWNTTSDANASLGGAIGARADGQSTSVFDGIIQDARFYQRAVSDAEVADIFRGGLGGTAPRSQWEMTTITGTAGTITDTSGNANATAVASPVYVSNIRTFTLTTAAASFALTENAVALDRDYNLAAGSASFAIAEGDAPLIHAARLPAVVADFALTEPAVGFQYSGGNPTLTAAPADFVLTEAPAGFSHAWAALVGESASFALTENSVNFPRQYRLTSVVAPYALTEAAAALRRGYELDTVGILVVGLGGSTMAGAYAVTTPWKTYYDNTLKSLRPGSVFSVLAASGNSVYQMLPTGYTGQPPGRPAVDTAKNITAACDLRPHAIIIQPSALLAIAMAQYGYTYDTLGDFVINEFLPFARVIDEYARQRGVPCHWITGAPVDTDLDVRFQAALMQERDGLEAMAPGRTIDVWDLLVAGGGDNSMNNAYTNDGQHPNDTATPLYAAQVAAQLDVSGYAGAAFHLGAWDALLVAARRLATAPASFLLTEQAAALRAAHVLLAANGGFALTENPVGFSISSSPTLTAGALALTLTEANAPLVASRHLQAGPLGLLIDEAGAAFRQGHVLTAAALGLALSEANASLVPSRALSAARAPYLLTLGNAALAVGELLVALERNTLTPARRSRILQVKP